jgi:ABC-type polysaccharide/polyol phosphate export permease
MVWGSGLLKRIYVPRTVFAVSCVGIGLVNTVFALGPLVLIMVVMGHSFHATWAFLPVAVAILSVFVLGVSLLMSALAVFFVDAVDAYKLFLRALFWLTPIIYPIEVISAEWRWVLKLNPMYYMVDLVRRPLYEGTIPEAGTILIACAFALAFLVAGAWYFTRKADELQYHL